MKGIGVMIMLGILVAGCSVFNHGSEVLAERIQAPEGEYSGLAWLPSGWLVTGYEPKEVGYEPGQPRPTWRLWRFRLDDGAFEQLPLGDDPRCFQTRFKDPSTLPDGRLGFVELCGPPLIRGEPVRGADVYLMAYNLDTGEVKPLVPRPINTLISQFTWNPDLSRGVVGAGDICASLLWLTQDGFEYFEITFSDEGRSWRLDEAFRRDLVTEGCSDLGQANLPSWSPNGHWIAFFASPQSIGVKDLARLDVPWNLYLMDPVDLKPRRVLANIKYPRSLAWSPDSRWLAFGGEVVGRGRGLWLFAPATGALHRVTSKYILWLAWSPDGQQIAGIWDPRPRDTSSFETEVWLFDVGGVVGTGK